ncbi:MAG: superoxide dismutase [Planctomycetes bacterium]|nr:superoxide dismutase [Planctomycetota bacterium]
MRCRTLITVASLVAVSLAGTRAFAHCQIPCGIYNDPVRFTLLEEHVATIEKSMNQIVALSKEQEPNYNQLVRWVTNKEEHADKLTEIVTFYFMAQRIKPADPQDTAAWSKYVGEVTMLHQIVVHAMKAKQTTDLEECAKLRELIGKFKASYLGAHAQTAAPSEHGDAHEHAHVHVHAPAPAPAHAPAPDHVHP